MLEGYIIREHRGYTERLRKLAEDEGLELRHFDIALKGVYYVLSRNPEVYLPVIMDNTGLRMAKTDLYLTEEFVVPPLRIYFSIEDENIVLLRGIEKRRGFGL